MRVIVIDAIDEFKSGDASADFNDSREHVNDFLANHRCCCCVYFRAFSSRARKI